MPIVARHPLQSSWKVRPGVAQRIREPKPEPSDLRTMLVTVGSLYGLLALLIAALIAADFVVAWLVTGQAY